MADEEAKRRLLKLLTYVLVAVVVIVVVSASLYLYFVVLAPTPTPTGPLTFRHAQTFTAEPDADLTIEFDYTPVRGEVRTALLYINVTAVEVTGGLEVRELGINMREISEPRVEQFDLDVSEINEGSNSIGIVNWGFEGKFQVIIYIEGSE